MGHKPYTDGLSGLCVAGAMLLSYYLQYIER